MSSSSVPSSSSTQHLLGVQRQRLMELRHAAQCCAPQGSVCSTTPYCSLLRRLLPHITRCKDTECAVTLCKSSRSLLAHYRACRGSTCALCQPVRVSGKRTLCEEDERELLQEMSMSVTWDKALAKRARTASEEDAVTTQGGAEEQKEDHSDSAAATTAHRKKAIAIAPEFLAMMSDLTQCSLCVSLCE